MSVNATAIRLADMITIASSIIIIKKIWNTFHPIPSQFIPFWFPFYLKPSPQHDQHLLHNTLSLPFIIQFNTSIHFGEDSSWSIDTSRWKTMWTLHTEHLGQIHNYYSFLFGYVALYICSSLFIFYFHLFISLCMEIVEFFAGTFSLKHSYV